MTRSIVRFMWGYQPHFRMSLEHAAESALTKIGAEALQPLSLLVGFAAEGGSAKFRVCVEPETGPVDPDALNHVTTAGEALYVASGDVNLIHTGEGVNDARHRQYRDRHRADALCQALGGLPLDSERMFFSGPARRVGEYDVYPVLGVNKGAFERLPALNTTEHTRMPMTRSLQHGVIRALLQDASRCLGFREPPASLVELSEDPATDAVASAARNLLYSVATMSGNFLAHGLYDAFRTLVSTPYEGRAGSGSVLLAGSNHPALLSTLRFSEPTSISAQRQFRKLLQMTGPGHDLLCDGEDLYGIGRLGSNYDVSSEAVFRLNVLGRGVWELSHDTTSLMRVDNGRPLLPRPRMSVERFTDTAKRQFHNIDDESIARLWSLALAGGEAAHGTMIVISEAAVEEVKRLAPQAIQVEPTYLTASTIPLLTDIDGAVLLSPDGTCHAGGVILDGLAAGKGDAGRGARYNSAVRYLQTTQANCMIIIVSEDGMIDIHPELRRLVSRREVDKAVNDFLTAASAEQPDFELLFKAREKVAELQFYLHEEQARALNAATDRVEAARWELANLRIEHRPFEVDPLMNKSYFVD